MSETHARSVAKAVSYRLLGSTVTALILLILTRKWSLSLLGGGLDVILKIGAYYVHERIWMRIGFGRTPVPVPFEPVTEDFCDLWDHKWHRVKIDRDGVGDCDCGCSSHSGACLKPGCFHCDPQRCDGVDLYLYKEDSCPSYGTQQ
jgi:adenylylsulfate kinase